MENDGFSKSINMICRESTESKNLPNFIIIYGWPIMLRQLTKIMFNYFSTEFLNYLNKQGSSKIGGITVDRGYWS